MQTQELKSLVESGRYKPDPSQIAAAMLSRRGVRELLMFGSGMGGSGHTPPSQAAPPRAA
jgi:Anti-sigma-28 factor, FlgM